MLCAGTRHGSLGLPNRLSHRRRHRGADVWLGGVVVSLPTGRGTRGDMGRKGTHSIGQGRPESWGFCGGLHQQLPPRPKPSSTPRTAPLPPPAPCSAHTRMLLGPAVSTPSHPFGEILGFGSKSLLCPTVHRFSQEERFPITGAPIEPKSLENI